MMERRSFFSLADLKQPVNQWLCIAFISLLCFWTVLYYFTQKAAIIADNYVGAYDRKP
jgi:hypothetical protein